MHMAFEYLYLCTLVDGSTWKTERQSNIQYMRYILSDDNVCTVVQIEQLSYLVFLLLAYLKHFSETIFLCAD